MHWVDTYRLVGSNISLEKVIADGKKLDFFTMLCDQACNNLQDVQYCDVYIKVMKTDCPGQIKRNTEPNIKEFKKDKCRMNYDVWMGEPNDVPEPADAHQYFPDDSKIVENTPLCFMLKFRLENITRGYILTKCNEMLDRLTTSCALCREDKWKDMDAKKCQQLHHKRKLQQLRRHQKDLKTIIANQIGRTKIKG